MIVHARSEDGQPLRDQQILAHINILLVAGHETTTILSTWVLYLLATLPEHCQCLQAELDAVAPGGFAPLTVETLRRLKRLDWLIKEAARLYPPVLNVPRVATSDFTFDGYLIPAGSRIRLALGASHLLPHVFADPQRFDPDRFAPPREEDHRTPYGFVPFGGGSRICIGMNFALIEIKALAAYVLRHYQLEAVGSRPPVQRGALLAALDAVHCACGRARTRSGHVHTVWVSSTIARRPCVATIARRPVLQEGLSWPSAIRPQRHRRACDGRLLGVILQQVLNTWSTS
jgi:cytochrome P450